MDVSQSDSAGSLLSDADVELPVKTTFASDVNIVSLQSTACPGAILQLDRILDAEHVRLHYSRQLLTWLFTAFILIDSVKTWVHLLVINLYNFCFSCILSYF